MRRVRFGSCCLPDQKQRVEHIIQRHGFQIQDAGAARQRTGRFLHFSFGNGAHVAKRLRHQKVRPQLFQHRHVERVQRQLGFQPLTNQSIYIGARGIMGNQCFCHLRQRSDGRGIVTFMRDADKLIFQTQRADDLGGARQ